jgi:hypothetical protein
MPSQQLQGQLQTKNSVDNKYLHYGQTQHKVKYILQANTGGKTDYCRKVNKHKK